MSSRKSKKVIVMIKDELRGKIMKELVAPRPKTYSYLMHDGNSDKNANGTKEYLIKRIFKFNDNKNWLLLGNEMITKSQQRFKNQNKDLKVKHIMYTLKKSIKLWKVLMMIKDCNLLIELHRILMLQVLGKVCKTELLEYLNIKWLILMIIHMKIK